MQAPNDSVDFTDLNATQKAELLKQWESQQTQIAKERLRMQIEGVADTKTREGVMSDVVGMMFVGLAELVVALSKAKSIADVNSAVQPLFKIGSAVDTAVKSGTLKLPYMVKDGGAQGVLADMTKLSNGIAAVIAASEPPAK
ncbi:hypothetical protein R16034_02968 [Ralstonia edaphis]|uniref:Uncharacterized protein n=1 Tax=Ralstonia edaphi TaxID=3058599 RepID=A0AB72X764_9RALS|nr:hypothetical protein [Ralstonia sp. LMG 6871]CAJ0742097.1 hypothetical protein R16034_02968 [Ralstonia sp. LMG 6871]